MQKSLLIAICILLSAPSALLAKGNKQRHYNDNYDYIDYKKSEIYIQYGAPTIIELTNQLDSKTQSDFGIKTGKHKYTGVGGVGYNFFINPYLSLGAYFGISEADMTLIDAAKGTELYTNHIRNYTALAGINWTYFRSGIWEASCGCSLGFARLDETHVLTSPGSNIKTPKEDDRYAFAYNLTATRVRVGGGVLGGFLEVGFGYKGLVNAGLSVKF